MHTIGPAVWEAEAGGCRDLEFEANPGQHSSRVASESRMLGEFKVGAATLDGGEVPQAAGGEKGVVAVAQEEERAA